MGRQRRFATALLLGAALLPGPAPRAAQAAEARLLRLGVMIEEPAEPDRILRLYSDLIGVMRKRLAPIDIQVPGIVIAKDIDDLAGRIAGGEVDFVIETVFPSLLLSERSQHLEPELVVIRRGERQYHSVFFTRKDAAIHSLEDLRGRTLVLQAARSTSAFALPRAELARYGMRMLPADTPERDTQAVRYRLAGAELNQAIWVLHERGDAGAFNEGDWEALPASVREQLRIFHRTQPILRALLSVRSGLDPELRAALGELLLALPQDPEGKAALQRATGITGFERLTAHDRAELRAWQATLRPFGSAP